MNFINPALASRVGVAFQISRASGYPFDYTKFNANQWRQGNSARPMNWWLQNHPDWIMYRCDGGVAWQYGDVPSDYHQAAAYVPLDFANPAVREFYWAEFLKPAIDNGAPLVFFDNLAVYNAFQSCGHYTLSGQWVQRYTADYQDAAYQADVFAWIEWLYARIKGYRPSVVVAYNYDPAESNDPPHIRDRVFNSLDMLFHEAGYNVWGQFKAVDDLWLRIKDQTESAQARGKAIFESETAMVIDPNQMSRDDKNWGLSNYLLFKGNQHYIGFSGSTCTGCTFNYNDYGYYVDMPEFYADLGPPTSGKYQSQGVWMRNYQRGLVIVNPAGLQGFNLNLGQAYKDYWNNDIGPSYFIPPQTGIVLLTPGGGTVPTPTPVATNTPVPGGTPSGRIQIAPASTSLNVGDTIETYLVLSANENFRAVSATVTVSSHLQVVSLTPPPVPFGPCAFETYGTYTVTPTAANPSFAASYNGGWASSCTLYKLTLRAVSGGTGTVTISNGSMLAFSNGAQIFQSATSGSYTIAGGAQPSPTPTPVPPTATPTNTPIAPTATPTSTPTQGTPSGRIFVAPSTGTYPVGTDFDVYVVLTAAQQFAAASASVSVSANLQVVSVTPPPALYGPCLFETYGSYSQTPTAANPSFAAQYNGASASSCTLYKMTLRPLAAGTGTVNVGGGSMLAFGSGAQIFQSATGASFTLTGGGAQPTATPTPVPSASPTPTPQVPPTATPTPQATSTPVPPANRTGTMMAYPYSGSYSVGQSFIVSIYVFGNGTQFTGAAANISLNRLAIQGIYPGTCNFSYSQAPSTGNASFAGQAPSPLDSCVAFYLQVVPTSQGTASISLGGARITTAGGADILKSTTDGQFVIS
jgi:hypothetical protein